MYIEELEKTEAAFWKNKNQKLFGLTPVDMEASISDIKKQLEKDEEMFWRKGTCALKEELLKSKKIVQLSTMFQDSFSLIYNEISNTICLAANFLMEADLDGKKLTKSELIKLMDTIRDLKNGKTPESDTFAEAVPKIELKVIAYLPLVTRLGYRIKKADYALRTQAIPNTGLIKRQNGRIIYKAKEYSISEFSKKMSQLDSISKMYLEGLLGSKLTKENIEEACQLLPEYDIHDFRNFTYKRFSAIRSIALHSPKTANVEKNRVINIASRLKSQSKYTKSNIASLSSNLILINTEIEALEVSRQVVYPSDAARGFSFTGIAPCGGGGVRRHFNNSL